MCRRLYIAGIRTAVPHWNCPGLPKITADQGMPDGPNSSLSFFLLKQSLKSKWRWLIELADGLKNLLIFET